MRSVPRYAILHALCNGSARALHSKDVMLLTTSDPTSFHSAFAFGNVQHLNGKFASDEQILEQDSLISRLLAWCIPSTSTERSRLLEENKELEDAYMEVARQGTSKVPEDAEAEVDFHYVRLLYNISIEHASIRAG